MILILNCSQYIFGDEQRLKSKPCLIEVENNARHSIFTYVFAAAYSVPFYWRLFSTSSARSNKNTAFQLAVITAGKGMINYYFEHYVDSYENKAINSLAIKNMADDRSRRICDNIKENRLTQAAGEMRSILRSPNIEKPAIRKELQLYIYQAFLDLCDISISEDTVNRLGEEVNIEYFNHLFECTITTIKRQKY